MSTLVIEQDVTVRSVTVTSDTLSVAEEGVSPHY